MSTAANAVYTSQRAPKLRKSEALKYAQLVCDSQGNVGDDIQSLAAALHLPRVDTTIDRELIHQWRGEGPVAMIMNGWFSSNAAAWPPPPSIRPVFVSFHVTERFKPTIREHAGYLKQFEPIGVRDKASCDFLQSIGIKAEVTYCLTLTFPRRPSAPRNGKVYLVDAGGIAVPLALRKGAVKLSHTIAPIGHQATVPYARRLLDMYRDSASLVITTRLHAALPCIAMGIPVIFFGAPSDGRTAVVNDIGGKIYDARLHGKAFARGILGRALDPVDWSPPPLDSTAIRRRLTAAVVERLAAIERDYR
jgi:hypothetical protein